MGVAWVGAWVEETGVASAASTEAEAVEKMGVALATSTAASTEAETVEKMGVALATSSEGETEAETVEKMGVAFATSTEGETEPRLAEDMAQRSAARSVRGSTPTWAARSERGLVAPLGAMTA